MQTQTTTTQKFDTYCPLFPGFYGTTFEYDDKEQDIDNYNEENGTSLGYDDFNWNYAGYHNRVAKAFVSKLEAELQHLLPVKIEFQEPYSPKEYNFSNDSINVSIEVDLAELIKLVTDRKEQATEHFKEKYTSCSGFISFHSPCFEDWINPEYILENTSYRIGGLLECLASIEIDRDSTAYWADDENYIDFSPKETN
jgi:hypothetical protein